jgi:peptidyl-prolyl cis-trans isomerase SurA
VNSNVKQGQNPYQAFELTARSLCIFSTLAHYHISSSTRFMRKLLFAIFVAAATQAQGQTLVTIGTDSVSTTEFLAAYKKNNTTAGNERDLRHYLQLFIASKLKVKEARALGLDTTAQFRSDLEALRAQIVPAYLNDPESVQRLASEAFIRAQKDLELAHIFIELQNSTGADTAAAFKKATEALAKLQSGSAFEAVAAQYSDDTAARTNGGKLGYITVFSLPYVLENLAYATPVGKLSPLYRSKAGYHILKVLSERPALGRMRAAQILLAFPPGAPNTEKLAIQKRADSLYKALLRGADFDPIAETFSNDAISAGAGGLLPEFGVGQYDPVFEQKAFSLQKDGAISQPFATAHGMHILKRVSVLPVAPKETEAVKETLRAAVQQSDRLQTTRKQQVQKILSEAGYKPLLQPIEKALRERTRQEFAGAVPAESLGNNTVLFRLGKEAFTVAQWLEWSRANSLVQDGGNASQPFETAWELFVQSAALKHYEQNLEQYNTAFRQQMAELEEGNLFFEIMQREIWAPAQTDSAQLKAFYTQHQNRYRWERSADAVVFYAANKAAADKLAAQVRKAPLRWRQQVGSADVTTDSARMEWSSIPGNEKTPFTANQVTIPQLNAADGTAQFAYIIKTYDQPVQRSFDEARGAIINDYQAQKEQEWVERLRKKYPVKVNEEALKKINLLSP